MSDTMDVFPHAVYHPHPLLPCPHVTHACAPTILFHHCPPLYLLPIPPHPHPTHTHVHMQKPACSPSCTCAHPYAYSHPILPTPSPLQAVRCDCIITWLADTECLALNPIQIQISYTTVNKTSLFSRVAEVQFSPVLQLFAQNHKPNLNLHKQKGRT